MLQKGLYMKALAWFYAAGIAQSAGLHPGWNASVFMPLAYRFAVLAFGTAQAYKVARLSGAGIRAFLEPCCKGQFFFELGEVVQVTGNHNFSSQFFLPAPRDGLVVLAAHCLAVVLVARVPIGARVPLELPSTGCALGVGGGSFSCRSRSGYGSGSGCGAAGKLCGAVMCCDGLWCVVVLSLIHI